MLSHLLSTGAHGRASLPALQCQRARASAEQPESHHGAGGEVHPVAVALHEPVEVFQFAGREVSSSAVEIAAAALLAPPVIAQQAIAFYARVISAYAGEKGVAL